ncbi:NAD(P)/FAD-dependent oxidoreductase [Candidatus Pseudothioglobus singularis]|nr:NAD(P)/FAD-dependent oxidoreductase [Candidatus Pseudothioglobus singularis]MDC3216540.1 NAD(P)/FAD-dependent oxidoreductase [Candidatus Pseudothioglobus singularis]
MKQRIAILGAGPMGLAVAYQLVKEGYHPVIFEADDRVGGMTAAFDFNGLSIERFYHFHCTSDKAFLDILNELGIAEKMNWVETKMGYWFLKQVQPWGNPVALLKFKGVSLVAKIRYGLHAFIANKRKRDNWRPLDDIEASGWIKRWVGKEAYDILWKRLIDYKFYHYANNLSAAWIWSRIRRIGTSRYSIFNEKLGFLDGGSETLLQEMKTYIEKNGGEFRLSCPVSKVIISDLKVNGVIVNGHLEEFEKVVSTIPLTYVPKLMPDLPVELLNKFSSINNIAVVCVIVKLKRPLTENFWLNINDSDMDIPGLVEYTNLRPLKDHIVYVPFYMPGEHPKYSESDQVFIDKVKRYLKNINKELNDNDFLDIRANRYRYAQPICTPKFLDKLPPVKLPVKGLWVADTSYYYPEDRGISESIDFGRMIGKKLSSDG